MSRKFTKKMKRERLNKIIKGTAKIIVEEFLKKERNVKKEEFCPLINNCNNLKELRHYPDELLLMYDIVCKDFKNCERYRQRENKKYIEKELEILKNIHNHKLREVEYML